MDLKPPYFDLTVKTTTKTLVLGFVLRLTVKLTRAIKYEVLPKNRVKGTFFAKTN